MARNKDREKSLSEKLKSFLGFKESTPLNFDHFKFELHHISPDIIKEVCPDKPMLNRLKILKELGETVMTKRIEDHVIENLFQSTRDMVTIENSMETRHTILQFYSCVIEAQLEKMTIMRAVFFQLILKHNIPEDASVRLELLKTLSENGKNIHNFEEEMGPFLLSWFPEILSSGAATDFLPLVINMIKHNAAYLDDEIVCGYLECVCSHCGKKSADQDVKIKLCLDVMDAVLCYSHLPSKVLRNFIFALCLTVNNEKFSQVSWKLMRDLLGTTLGHSTVYSLCLFLQDKRNQRVPQALRGSVFFIGMALWGSKKVETLPHPPSTVLPSFCMALDCNSNSVAFEVALSVQRLVKKNGGSMPTYEWNLILDVVESLLKYPELQQHQLPIYPLATCVHDLITAIEDYNTPYCNERLYKIIEHCSDQRDESSVIRLIKYHAENIHPIKEDFIANITHLLEKYFKNEKRPNIQMAVIQNLKTIRVGNGLFFEDDVMDQTILYFMCHLDTVPDVAVRTAVIELLLEMAEMCITKRYFDILEIVEKVMKSYFEKQYSDKGRKPSTSADVEAAVSGLINIFEKKLYTLPSNHCVKVYNILVSHVMLQYRHLSYSEGNTKIRRMIISFFLKIRTNFKKQVGILVDGRVSYSVYVLCDTPELPSDASSYVPSSPAPGSPAVFTVFPLTHCFKEMFQALINSLKMEKDWIILELLFVELPKLLQNKALVICGNCNLNLLCVALCALVNDRSFGYPEKLHNAPARMTLTDFQSQIFPVIASLAAYHSELDSRTQGMLIRCLQSGLVSRSAKVCIEGLTLCTLEMRDMMVKYMPSVLLKLSQISATVTVSVAVLEFLSNLIRLPPLYLSFVEDQYRSIFAIALPYTNPYKFNQYTVALAHHVIAMWFLKCRIPFRKEFSKYIAKGLRSNMSLPMDDNHSSAPTKSESSDKSKSNTSDEATRTLHTELLEIGLDLMARFTFGMSSNAPKRSAVAEFLLEKGQKASWVIGNKIVTITTSGCGTKSFKYGLCEKCYSCCREICDSMSSDDSESALPTSPEPPIELPLEGRRRHKSALNRRNTTLMETTKLTKDDILLHRQKPRIRHTFRRNTSCAATVPEASAPPATELELHPTEDANTLDDNKSNTYQLCSCWCSGWAEVYTRQPTGNSSWMMRIQNQLFLPTSSPNIVLPAISSLLLPNRTKIKEDAPSPKENPGPELQFECANDKEEVSGSETAADDSGEVASSATSNALNCPKSKVPLRRTNSSPDMNSGFMSYSRQFAVRKSALRSQVTKEEQTLIENGSNGEIFHFEDERHKAVEAVAPKSRVRIRTHPDINVPKTTFRDPPKMDPPTGLEKGLESANLPNAFRDRGHTISVMSPNRAGTSGGVPTSRRNKDMHRSGMNPSFVFLQLYHNSFLSSSFKPLVIRQTEQNLRSLSVIDHIHPYDTHKIGVIFVGPGQMDNEQAILSNLSGSNRYLHFLRRLGVLIRLSAVDQELTYVGGLDLKGYDGKYALVWHDDVMRVAFHVATLMPNREDDPKRNNKKTHVGNNFVTIVYNESNEDYIIGTIKSQFTRACVIIHPEDYNSNVVTIKTKNKDLRDVFGHTDAYIVSDESLPIFVRQMALHANLASLILDPRQQSAHVSNWLARLRAIKRLRAKLTEEAKLNSDGSKTDCQSNFFIDDFTDYV